MTALLAAFVGLFVLTSAVDAATCTTEPVVEASIEFAVDGSVDTGSGEAPDDHAICSHGHCHHGGAMVAFGCELSPAVTSGALRVLLPSEPLASRTPSGLDRPPRG